jgi:hypothetical protein
MFINIKVERYCHKCHKIQMAYNFKKFLPAFKDSGICKTCLEEQKEHYYKVNEHHFINKNRQTVK